MKHDVSQQAKEYAKEHKSRKRWYQIFIGLAFIVVFGTIYALSMPATTMEKGQCDIPEHTHDDSCYKEETIVTKTPVCTKKNLNIHTHTKECYNEKQELICGYADYLVHEHDSSCYDENGELWCFLPEIKAHTHNDSCYKEISDAKSQAFLKKGYELNQFKLICKKQENDQHQHTEECYDLNQVLDCGQEEIILHKHTKECYDEEDNLICGKTEILKHEHSDECFETEEETRKTDELICGKEEHIHTDECKEPVKATDTEQEEETTEAETIEEEIPVLLDDSAAVDELNVTESKVLFANTDTAEKTDKLSNGDILQFSFNVKTKSYTNINYRKGRVKLEFILPLTSDQAIFDASKMTWLDNTEGYEPSNTTEIRKIDGKDVSCQVLTGYKLLETTEETDSVIPGEFTEDVFVQIVNMNPNESIAVQINAAMEYNTWEAQCDTHLVTEKLSVTTDSYYVVEQLTEDEMNSIYQEFLAEVKELKKKDKLDEAEEKQAEELLKRLKDAYEQGNLSEEDYIELYDRVYKLLYREEPNTIAEAAEGSNWMRLRDSGWFDEYSNDTSSSTSDMEINSSSEKTTRVAASVARYLSQSGPSAKSVPASDQQVEDRGGSQTSEDGAVTVSKTISGTDLENVFDITLNVQTSMNVDEVIEEPDMAVVIVMDISNTMKDNFGGVTRYAAAMSAAENFLDQFAANNSLGISKVGYVAFNTDAHNIFGLQSCSNQTQANTLKNTMRTKTGNIINVSGYNSLHSRFTNVEAGLAMASDMLNGVSNKNKYIIFLSDGFPTTYIQSGYSGYDPYDSTGRFYDHVLNKKCLYGTSYSDEAAIRARKKATAIKNSGTKIFSIGVDVAGQTIQKYITQSENANGFSVVDRTGTTYEIGDASSTEAYKSWLGNSIGSGYYYDSTNSEGLTNAYNKIFEQIKHQIAEGSQADWVAADPIPTVAGSAENVEFIGFYNKNPELVSGDLTGTHETSGENTATFDNSTYAISWDLKNSGYQTSTSGGTTTYTYQLVYRVRLKNEKDSFSEETVYPTNDTTTLQYRCINGTDGNYTISDPKTVEFPIPSVKGYLAELLFSKIDSFDEPVKGAEFTLIHDTRNCNICHGDNAAVTVENMIAISDENGNVSFTEIPSGHKYILEETKVPDGYAKGQETYSVEVAYDELTVVAKNADGESIEWQNKIVNKTSRELPNTGGSGTIPYTMGGLLLLTISGLTLMYRSKKRRREA